MRDSSEQQETLTPRVQAIVSPLRPCCFCGCVPCEAIMQWPRGGEKIVWTVSCTQCGTHGPIHEVPEMAVKQWNNRHWEFSETWDTLLKDKQNER